jgi:hypothetical protein
MSMTGSTPFKLYRRLRFGGDGVATETLAGNKVLVFTDEHFQSIDPGGASRSVTLEAEAEAQGHFHLIVNAGSAGELITVQDDTPATIAVLDAGEWVFVGCDGTSWYNLMGVPSGTMAGVADPGDAAAIPVNRSGTVAIATGAGGETNTLAIPGFLGQRLILTMDVDGGGDRVITAASAINATGNTVMTFGDARDTIELVAIQLAGVLAWEVAFNSGVALS